MNETDKRREFQQIKGLGIFVILLVVCLAIMPVSIYTYYAIFCQVSPVWNPSDILQYVAMAISSLGTLVLGYIAFCTNKKMEYINREMMTIAKRSLTREERNETPLIDFTTILRPDGSEYLKAKFIEANHVYRMQFWVKNVATYGIKDIKIVEAVLEVGTRATEDKNIKLDDENSLAFLEKESNQTKVSILPKQEVIICLYFPYMEFPPQNTQFHIRIVFENKNNNGTILYETINLSFNRNYMIDFLDDKEWALQLFSKEVRYKWL